MQRDGSTISSERKANDSANLSPRVSQKRSGGYLKHSLAAAAIVLGHFLYQGPSPSSLIKSIRTAQSAPPTVQLDAGTLVGKVVTAKDSEGVSQSINAFLGIRYATASRFALPVLQTQYTGTQAASQFGPACPQQTVTFPPTHGVSEWALQKIIETTFRDKPHAISEDCFNLNVYAPKDASPASKLPVVVWIYGGGFLEGAAELYKGENMIAESINLGKEIVLVAMNYRVSALGFLAGSEVNEAGIGNLGLRDQRTALQWVQRFVGQFGGDPNHVTIWGESAGAISVSLQMLTNNGNPEGLFHGAIMQSGAPPPVGDSAQGQKYYNELVQATGCSGSSNTLDCLRTADANKLYTAINASPSFFSPQALNLAWLPRSDGPNGFLPQPPFDMVKNGPVAPVPFIAGNCDDEGTIFTLPLTGMKTPEELAKWLAESFLPSWDAGQAQQLLSFYPAKTSAYNSPFNTNWANDLQPMWMQTAAIQGDVVFQAPRRYFMQNSKTNHPMWGFLSTRSKHMWSVLSYIGSYHGNDLADAFNTIGSSILGPHTFDLQQYIICFVHDLNPNGSGQCGSQPVWPQYDPTSSAPPILNFTSVKPNWHSKYKAAILPADDTYRADAFDFIYTLMQEHPLGQHP